MDYRAFFWDVYLWIQQANQMATQHGMANPLFWEWVADAAGALNLKYQSHPLVIKQMVMLVEWLEDAYERSNG